MQIGGVINNYNGGSPPKGGGLLNVLIGAVVVFLALVTAVRLLTPAAVATSVAFNAFMGVLTRIAVVAAVVAVGVGAPLWARYRLREARENRRLMDEHQAEMVGLPRLMPAPAPRALPPGRAYAVDTRGQARQIERNR